MSPADLLAIRQLIREELATFRLLEPVDEIRMDADHMAKLILSGRSGEVKRLQKEKMRRAA